jgi:predicted nucleic acid-binding Zn ribbon protein
MDANDIILWFSIVVIALVILWAVLMIRAYDKVDKE